MTRRRQTDDLIRDLAARPAPLPFQPALAAGAMLAALAAGLGMYFLAFGLRPDLGAAWGLVAVQAKTVIPALLSVCAIWLALRSSRPGASVTLWPLAVPAALAAALFVPQVGGAGVARLSDLADSTAFACLLSIIPLSVLPLLAGVAMLRDAAPTRPVLTGTLLGIAAGAGVAAGYALHCVEDAPMFFVFWYGLGIAVAGGFGGWLGHRILRW